MHKNADPTKPYSRLNPNYNKNKQLVGRYGINLEQYNEMFAQQEGKCLLCDRHQSEFKKALAVDHDHQTGKVRSLLCDNCNKGIGCLQVNIEILKKAVAYLESHQASIKEIK